MDDHASVKFWGLEVLANNLRAYNLYRQLGFEINEDVLVKEIEREGRLIPSLCMHRREPNG